MKKAHSPGIIQGIAENSANIKRFYKVHAVKVGAAEKYGGQLTTKYEKGTFTLKILIPIP